MNVDYSILNQFAGFMYPMSPAVTYALTPPWLCDISDAQHSWYHDCSNQVGYTNNAFG